jgi:hypothetical protein
MSTEVADLHITYVVICVFAVLEFDLGMFGKRFGKKVTRVILINLFYLSLIFERLQIILFIFYFF